MKTIAAISADLETSTIGTSSRLTAELGGMPVLRRTVERVTHAGLVDDVYVLCPEEQLSRCRAMLEGTGAVVRCHEGRAPSWNLLTRCARKWSLDGWRGGIGGSTCFDEYTDCSLLSGLLETVEAKWVLSVPPAAPLIDPELADAMIDHRLKADDEVQLAFTQAPPGLAGVLLEKGLIHELAGKGIPLGWLFAYQPDSPRKDVIFQSSCHEIPAGLRYVAGRLMADTDRSIQRIADLMREHDSPSLETIGPWLGEREASLTEPLPREVEIELTTDDPYPDAMLRPRGSRLGRSGHIDAGIVRGVVSEMVRYDDALVVLGGFGDPLRHPRFRSLLDALRTPGADGRKLFGLAVRTSGVDLDDALIEAMIDGEVDILNVVLDAWTPEMYGELQTPSTAEPRDSACANLENVLARLERVTQLREVRGSVRPIVVPEMTKARENVRELDDFYDGWIRRMGAVTISGHCHFAGQCDDRSVIRMAPPSRCACRRIQSRCLVLADGRVAMCDQDFRGLHTIGSLHERSLEEIWLSRGFEGVRAAHRAGNFGPTPLCARCDEWHRP